jgi:hypothetical protein
MPKTIVATIPKMPSSIPVSNLTVPGRPFSLPVVHAAALRWLRGKHYTARRVWKTSSVVATGGAAT